MDIHNRDVYFELRSHEIYIACYDPNYTDNDIIYMLEKSELPLNYQDFNGDTVFHFACMLSRLYLMKYLVNSGKIDINVKNNDGDSPLHDACAASGYGLDLDLDLCKIYLNVVEFLLRLGADIDSINHDGFKPVHKAAEFKNLFIIKLLMEYGARIDESTSNGQTVLSLCEGEKNLYIDILKLLWNVK